MNERTADESAQDTHQARVEQTQKQWDKESNTRKKKNKWVFNWKKYYIFECWNRMENRIGNNSTLRTLRISKRKEPNHSGEHTYVTYKNMMIWTRSMHTHTCIRTHHQNDKCEFNEKKKKMETRKKSNETGSYQVKRMHKPQKTQNEHKWKYYSCVCAHMLWLISPYYEANQPTVVYCVRSVFIFISLVSCSYTSRLRRRDDDDVYIWFGFCVYWCWCAYLFVNGKRRRWQRRPRPLHCLYCSLLCWNVHEAYPNPYATNKQKNRQKRTRIRCEVEAKYIECVCVCDAFALLFSFVFSCSFATYGWMIVV